MQIELIKGQFSGTEALDILSQMIQVKIKFHKIVVKKILNTVKAG